MKRSLSLLDQPASVSNSGDINPSNDRESKRFAYFLINNAIVRTIKECREQGERFQKPTDLSLADATLLLHILLTAFKLAPSDMKSCDNYLVQNFGLFPQLNLAYGKNNFEELHNHFVSLDCFNSALGGNPAGYGGIPMSRSSRAANNSHDSRNLKEAFEVPYEGNLPKLFIRTLNKNCRSISRLVASDSAYNKSISIIQSSGMGKSRMVDEAGNLIVTIPINIREKLDPSKTTYPPADDNLREYFDHSDMESDQYQQAKHAIFLTALFDAVTPKIKECAGPNLQADSQARDWADYLKEDRTTKEVGLRRKELYRDVVKEANKQVRALQITFTEIQITDEVTDTAPMKSRAGSVEVDTVTNPDALAMDIDTPPTNPDAIPMQTKTPVVNTKLRLLVLKDPKVLGTLYGKLRRSWSRLQNALVPEAGRNPADNMCLVYFDEAHGLTKPPSQVTPMRRMSSYHNLGKVLAELCKEPVFFVFLSTNSNLHQFAPPPSDHPSARVSEGHAIFPPFTELPFDVFVQEAFKNMTVDGKQVSLNDVCTTDIMSHFGRPMWYTHHRLWLNQQGLEELSSEGERVDHVFSFAKNKIAAHGAKDKSFASDLAAVGIRVGVDFDSRNRSSRLMETKLVESHMRVVFAIPEHREYMRTGSPSEPILAEAAATCLEKYDGKIRDAGPRILAESCQAGFLAQGERGELCGRLLLTIAHDLALPQTNPEEFDSTKPNYHVPIPVLDFLRALFAKDQHQTVLKATPLNFDVLPTGPDQPLTLEQAFKNAYVSFSHFELAEDADVLAASELRYSLIRGCAIQTREGQGSIDVVIPIHMGSVSDPITTETVSAINVQFKNRKATSYCAVDRSITVQNAKQPVISIVFELGDRATRVSLVRAEKLPNGKPQDPSNDRHYQLVARGRGPETFNAVSAQSKASYDIILGTGDLMHDFPRRGDPELVEYVQRMRPLRYEYAKKHLSLLDSRHTNMVK